MTVFEPLAKALAERSTPVSVFFRDDDAGWADQRLQLLCKLFVEQQIPLDIAAIPNAIGAESAARINAMIASGNPWLQLHQHGYTHLNHQQTGRSCEFGTERSLAEQREDIAAGQALLADRFGNHVKPIFTPPWNRCTATTASILQSLGFAALSRIKDSEPLATELLELDVSIDWLKKRKGVRLTINQISTLVCNGFASATGPVGIMLHHEQMDEANREALMELIQVLKNAHVVRFESMSDLVSD